MTKKKEKELAYDVQAEAQAIFLSLYRPAPGFTEIDEFLTSRQIRNMLHEYLDPDHRDSLSVLRMMKAAKFKIKNIDGQAFYCCSSLVVLPAAN